MRVNFIAQPGEQLGFLLTGALASVPSPSKVVMVSAFASLQAVLRIKSALCELAEKGAVVRLVVGIDMGGTSKEVLKELATWPIEVLIFKNRKSGVTFHPKIYFVQSAALGELFLGSNNLTDGGLYGNYEGAARVTYELPDDTEELNRAERQLERFLNPTAPVARRLSVEYLQLLLQRRDIPDEAEARRRRKEAMGQRQAGNSIETFGFEPTQGPPRLPLSVQQVVLAAVRSQLSELEERRRNAKRSTSKKTDKAPKIGADSPVSAAKDDIRSIEPLAQLSPTSFYMEITATKGKHGNIPGEQRIPLEAIAAARDFWGWPDNYAEKRNPRKGDNQTGEDRIYLDWKPAWRVRNPSDPGADVTKNGVRMYFYVNSADFRFYSSDLAKWAKAGDIIEITRVDDEKYVYECVLAVAGTQLHEDWKNLCNQGGKHTDRTFGFA